MMKVRKQLVCPQKVRKIPSQFSWVDHRLIRDDRLNGCSPSAWALYLFLVTVADAEGLSYYADPSIQRRLGIGMDELVRARSELAQAEVIAYAQPFYQVLTLDRPGAAIPFSRLREGEARSLNEVLRTLGGGAR